MMFTSRPVTHKKVDIYDSEIGTEIRKALCDLEADPAYVTLVSYTSDREKYPDGTMPFVDKHLLYLHLHRAVNPLHYLSNLRLQLRLRA